MGKPLQVLRDLDGQLTGGNNDQGVDLIVMPGGKELVDDGQEKCGCLTRAGLSGRDKIFAV